MSPKQITEFRQRLLGWYSRHGRDLPWRHRSDPYAILVSEIMLQQTQVTTVIPFYYRWLERFPILGDLAAASEDEVLHAWQGLGYYTRARNLHATAKLVTRNHQSVLPRDPESLRTLPGMGRYTANAVATFAYDQPVPIVEANIARLLARLFNVRVPIDASPGRERLWKLAGMLVPKRNAARFNSALMDLGATICTRSPQCHICPAKTFCRAPRPEVLPIKKSRPETVRLTESHLFVRRRNQLLLERCTRRWRGMWMLPRLPNGGKGRSAGGLARSDGFPAAGYGKLGGGDAAAPCEHSHLEIHSAVFPFTNHQIALHVFRVQPGGRRCACPTTANQGRRHAAVVGQAHRLPKQTRKWVRIADLHSIAIPSPHRRAINACLSLSVGRSTFGVRRSLLVDAKRGFRP